ncbi:MAG: hypothetical protein DRH06_07770 [Deltaproteobacteria bacterium]|nr:MAG: hypothetical protein DRH07_10565 [Deltaproteobacteria bacterium]RLB75529.1 MAG: hypothetical protein DRH06_07770 [Deltaproteobacteria bacterium]
MKALFKLFIALLVVVVIVVVGAFFYIDSIAKKAIEQGGEMALGVTTNLESVHISLLGGEASLSGLQIANPVGFKAQTFMELGQGEVAISLGSLMGDTVKIPRVKLSNIRVNLEQSGKKNNIDPILARAKSMGGGKGGKSASQVSQPAAEGGKKFIIEYFSLEDVQVNASLDLLGHSSSVNLVLPKIELHNLGAEDQGLPLSELVQKIVHAILSVAQESSGKLSPALAKLLAGELKGLDGIQTKVIGQATVQVKKTVSDLQENIKKQVPENLPSDVDKAIHETGESVLKGVGNLFGGDKK